MSISRAFTTRKLRMSFDASSESNRNSHRNSQPLRHKISAPMQLLHTTNILSYNAPDLPRPAVNGSPVSVSSSARSEHDSDSITTVDTTPPASPEAPKPERATTSKRHHLSDFFRFPAKPLFPHAEVEAPPAIPQRAPSHTKKNSFEALARSASSTRLSKEFDEPASGRRSRSSSISTRNFSNPNSISSRSLKYASAQPTSPATTVSDVELPVKELHPFGLELAQVTELAEEYGSGDLSEILAEDADYILSHGLSKLSADDYISVVDDLSTSFFTEPASTELATSSS